MLLPLLALTNAVLAPTQATPTPLRAAEWIRPQDYPKADRRAGTTGTVIYRLDVGSNGRVRGCSVVRSSGDATLDDATCRLLRVRAHFVSPTDTLGHPEASIYEGSLRWTLPESAPVVAVNGRSLPPISLAAPDSWPGQIVRVGKGFHSPFRVAVDGVIAIPPPAAPIRVAETEMPPADATVRVGRLPNGLSYRVMRNVVPAGGVSMRLRVAAGAIDETTAEAGYAHFVEHMTFRGTANVPDGQLVKSLEQMGLALGADTTANTTEEATTFGLDFPPTRSSSLISGLFLLREMASRATFAPDAVAAERNVILAEKRLRDGPGLQAEQERVAFLLDGQPLADRSPIGSVGTISNASAVALKAFYETHYRPDGMILIVVGDLDLDEVEASIKASFGDWTSKVSSPTPPSQGHVRPRSTSVRQFAQPGAPRRLEAHWVSSYDAMPDTLAQERSNLAEELAVIILNDRLLRLVQTPDAPIVLAEAQRNTLFHSAKLTSLLAVASSGREMDTLAEMVAEQKRFIRFGVSKAELGRAETRIRNVVTQAAASSGARSTPVLADELLSSVTEGKVFTTPAQTAEDYKDILSTLTVADVSVAAVRLFSGSGPLLFISGADRSFTQAAIIGSLRKAEHLSSAPPPAVAITDWPYSDFGTAGAVGDRREISDLGVTVVRFTNGTSVTVKSSPIPQDQIVVMASFGAGLAGLPKALEHSYWALSNSPQLFINGGLGKATANAMKDQLDGKLVGVQFQAMEDQFVLEGRTRRSDLRQELSLISAYLSDPGFRAEAWRQAHELVGSMLAEIDTSPISVANNARSLLLHDGDKRWAAFPTLADFQAGRPEDVAMLLKPALSGPINLVVVGDVDVDQAIEVARETVGALPLRGPPPAIRPFRFPAAYGLNPIRIAHRGRPDQGVAFAAWSMPGFYSDTAGARAVQVLAGIINGRLIDGLREKDGLTYAPAVIVDQSVISSTYGALVAQVEISPSKAERFFSELDSITADLARASVSIEELERARAPILDQSRALFASADYWASELTQIVAEPRQVDTIRSRLRDLSSVTPADIQRLAKALFADKPPLRAVVASPLAFKD